MSISQEVRLSLQKSSAIRKMFEAGVALKKKYGAENVYDFSLGNPCFSPPSRVVEALAKITASPPNGRHAYMPNVGHLSVRERIAQYLSVRDERDVSANDIVMCVGAGGGLNVILKAIINHGDEVVVIAPYFPEYKFYVQNYGGKLIVCDSFSGFALNFDALAKCFSPYTKAVIINSPNNPSGVVYTSEELKKLEITMMYFKDKFKDSTIYLISDEPYRRLVYDDVECSSIGEYYNNSVIVTSFSKDLGLAGERIGYIYLHPRLKIPLLREALAFTTRTLGFCNAPALMQELVARTISETIDLAPLARKRALVANIFDEAGIEYTMPKGAFYFFPKVPKGDDDEKFCEFLQENYRILVVAGRTFGRAGYFRLSYSVSDETILNSRTEWVKAVADWKSHR